MPGSLRVYALLTGMAALLVVVGVVGSHGGALSSGDRMDPGNALNRIVYVALDGQIHTVSPDGRDAEQITVGDGFYTWPTWSPDGDTMVFSGVVGGEADEGKLGLYSHTIGGSTGAIYVDEPDVSSVLAYGVVHYAQWSPDSTRLSFVATTRQGPALFLQTRGGESRRVRIPRSGPIWTSWAPDSRHLLVHRGPELYLADAEENGKTVDLGIRTEGYRVAAWQPPGDKITLVADDLSGGLAIVSADVDAGNRTVVDRVALNAAFLWASDGSYLAVATPDRGLAHRGLYLLASGGVTLYPADNHLSTLEIDEDVIAFFWSPDSASLAYVTSPNPLGVMSWRIMEVGSGTRRSLVDFIPSLDQLTMFQFFDQYAYSHALWSPDSSSLVFAGVLPDGLLPVSSRQPTTPRIIVLGVGESPTVDEIAEGFLGFWSWR